MSTDQAGHRFYFVGERLCVDFVNTEVVTDGVGVDLLRNFNDLVSWCAAAHVVSPAEAKEIARQWDGKPDGERTFQRALQFRAVLREMLERVAAGRRNVPQPALDAINDVLRLRAGILELARTKEGYEMRLRRDFGGPVQLLVPIAESAAELLSADDLALIRKCQNPQCILYFYDTTKNHGRRWCSMTACGNRAKAAAHYRRTRQHASGPS
jgi:predicted RNA-binding Zn ribbon-like protein